MNQDLIEFSKFSKKFHKNQIGELSFTVKPNRVTAVIGRSGSGKSVILNSLIGAIKNYKGTIKLNNRDRKKRDSYKDNSSIGFYTQMDFSLYDISAYKFLQIICPSFGINKKDLNSKIEQWMKFFDIWDSKDKSLKNYSWGMKNRMNLILCFIKDPKIIILDEPGANLDSIWRNKVKNLLIKEKKEGKTIIITVHNIDEIADIIDDYLIIDAGKIIFYGSSEELNIYTKYKIFFFENINHQKLRNFLNENKIKSFKYDEEEKSLVFATNNAKEINWIFLYLLKEGIPIFNLIKLNINMDSIFKAIENKQIKRTKI
ncbi:ATP-binding cassette domain-containing protein [Spiroplasma cantharicola]|uniref:ABC transporter ATP-binding protein n=1 Tax=Spiroplasma cantharicola TaxID=362837 RepID=A0A0M5KCF7_9MOLU|nr:ABC transporter ATP-binding protein [Spiroplasma cantharicola]ALD66093.1 ABC transporter ATP-binding protein [Spiroplasma cantharicola]